MTRNQVFLDLRHPISRRWRIGFTERYDFEEGQELETALRFEYDACCWAFRVQGIRRIDRQEEIRNALFFTLEFDNLGALTTRF